MSVLAVEEPADNAAREQWSSPVRPPSDLTSSLSSSHLGRFAAALRELASRQEVDETLQLAVDLSTELIGGCDLADVMFVRKGGLTTPVSSEPLAQELDQLQDEFGEGPCLTAARSEPVVRCEDLASDPRWPVFGPRASALGVRSAASYQLYLHRTDGDRFGALNLYGTEPGGFDDTGIALGEVFAAHCSTALAAAIAREGAEAALTSRDVIGQAKGILMASLQVDAVEAFDLLSGTSQELNVKLRDVAGHVTRTGTLP